MKYNVLGLGRISCITLYIQLYVVLFHALALCYPACMPVVHVQSDILSFNTSAIIAFVCFQGSLQESVDYSCAALSEPSVVPSIGGSFLTHVSSFTHTLFSSRDCGTNR